MKKFAILTSVLALTACGGGSGGGAPNDVLTPEQRAAAIASNSRITNMDSFIVVGGSNPTVNSNARAATTGVQQSDGGIRYDLRDVEFKTASMAMNTGVDDRAVIMFETKDGKIDKVKITLKGIDDVGSDIDMKIIGERRGDTNVFADGVFSFKENGIEQAQTLPNEDFGLLYSSKAKDNNQHLHYADWGVVQWGDVGNWDTSNYFAGGYDVKRTDKDNYAHMNELARNAIGEKLIFSGRADGVVRIGDMSDDTDPLYIEGVNKLSLSTNATLEFAAGKSTLTANFDNWYDVKATMDNTGNLTNLVFANGDKVDNNHNPIIADTFKWSRDGSSFNEYTAEATKDVPIIDPHFVCPSGNYCTDSIIRDGFVEYYGDNGNPAEAVGVIRYGDTFKHAGGAMRFDMGFGGTRK